MICATQKSLLSATHLGTIFFGTYTKASFGAVDKRNKLSLVLPCFLAGKHFMVWLTQPGSKRHPWNFRTVQKQSVVGLGLQHESFLPHKFLSFMLVKGDTLSPLGLEDLQRHNSVQTTLKNITLLEQLQGWDQGFEKGPFSRFLLLFTQNKACLTILKCPSFSGLNPLCRKSMQMLYRVPLSVATLIQLSFFCLAHPTQHLPPARDQPSNATIFHSSESYLHIPAAAPKKGSFSHNELYSSAYCLRYGNCAKSQQVMDAFILVLIYMFFVFVIFPPQQSSSVFFHLTTSSPGSSFK